MDKQTIDTYNQMALEYDAETADFWNRFPHTIIDRFADLVQGRVLDIGSGPGRDGVILQKKGLEVTCLDASEAMIKLSTSRGLLSVLGDFCALPFPDAIFDGVWTYTALPHVPKTKVGTAFSEITRVLKKGGILGLGLIEGDTELYRESSGVGKPRWFSYYQKDEVEKLLQAHGFSVVYFETFKPGSKNYLHFIAQKTI